MAKHKLVDGSRLVDNMTDEELSRWLALYTAINKIAETADIKGLKFDVLVMNQNAIEDYINTESKHIYHNLKLEQRNNKLEKKTHD